MPLLATPGNHSGPCHTTSGGVPADASVSSLTCQLVSPGLIKATLWGALAASYSVAIWRKMRSSVALAWASHSRVTSRRAARGRLGLPGRRAARQRRRRPHQAGGRQARHQGATG